MILVAFVLVLFATVMLFIGTFFPPDDNGLTLIWFAIAACLLTFGVLTASWMARRRAADAPAARPVPLGTDEQRDAPTRSVEPVASVTLAEPDAVTVTVREPEVEAPAPEPEPAVAAEPAPRPVAPRRVVRRAPVPAEATVDAASAPAEAPSAAPTPTPTTTTTTTTRRVVRRVPAQGAATAARAQATTPTTTRTVVRRAAPVAGATSGTAPTRTVTRVVRAAPAAAKPAAKAASAKPAAKAKPTGTRGAKARTILGEIKGVGPAKQDALLKKFGSLEAMAEASVEELTAVKGVGDAVAVTLLKELKKR